MFSLEREMKTPHSTVRIQLNKDFDLNKLTNLRDYYDKLGIKGLYLAPAFKAREGSNHGYDVVDFKQIGSEIGGIDKYHEMTRSYKRKGFFILQDFVPNHMSFDANNYYLMNILELGDYSPFKGHFDIDWDHHHPNLKGKLLIPILGTYYGAALENQELKLDYDKKGFCLRYYAFRIPLTIESYTQILGSEKNHQEDGRQVDSNLLSLHGHALYLKSLVESQSSEDILNQVDHAKKMIWEKYQEDEASRNFINEQLNLFNGEKGNRESFNLLDDLLYSQRFRLSYWKVAAEEINYRRFFTINDLIGVRVEDEKVFNSYHSLIGELIREGMVDGIRLDHIDGLYDPEKYIKDLKKQFPSSYVVAEKILERGELIPESFQLEGTTGYDFLTYINQLFCLKKNEPHFDTIYQKFCGEKLNYHKLLLENKRLIITRHLLGNIDSLAHYLKGVAGNGRVGRDLTYYSLRKAMVEFMVDLPVYRTYTNSFKVSEEDLKVIGETIQKSLKRRPYLEYELNFLKSVLTLSMEGVGEEDIKEKLKYFVMGFQQLTGPVMAKGLEDTVFYIYNRLISLNEVGGGAQEFGISLKKFHQFLRDRREKSPHTMNATSTHDTKMGEDGRNRLHVLSEIPQMWKSKILKWEKINKELREGKKVYPDKNDEYRLYQAMLSSFNPQEEKFEIFLGRIQNYMLKAVREAKVYTEWIRPDHEYEGTLKRFIDRVFDRESNKVFWDDFLDFQKYISFYGALSSLSMVTLKIMAPGIPDFYQGCETHNYSLVDPDNRRPVKFEKLSEELSCLDKINLKDYRKDLINGKLKLFVTSKLLHFRRVDEDFWGKASYAPLKMSGNRQNKVIASIRELKRGDHTAVVITIGTRFLTDVLGTDELGKKSFFDDLFLHVPSYRGKTFRNCLTEELIVVPEDGRILLSQALGNLTIGVLTLEL